jgi:hypothetical protein
MIKADPGQPTLSQLRELVARLHWLMPLNMGAVALAAVPAAKVQHFAAEAKSLDAARMQRLGPPKRYTLIAALIKVQVAQALDDLGEMFLKSMRKIHHKGQAALEDYRRRQQGRMDELILILYELMVTLQQEESPEVCLAAMLEVIGDQAEAIMEDCLAYTAYADNNYFPLLWRFYKSHRQTLFGLLEHVELSSTSQDKTVEEAISLLSENRTSKRPWLDLTTTALDLSWVPEKWWKLVAGPGPRHRCPDRVDRRQFEVCVFSQVMGELRSGDLCIAGSSEFADYQEQLISWEEYERTVTAYGEEVGLPVENRAFVTHRCSFLEETAAAIDASFPSNIAVRIENGSPILRRLPKQPTPKALKALERLIAERLEPLNVLEVLTDTENWLRWTRFFSLLSGREARIEEVRARYVATTFCYGCNLGPTQTVKP